MKPKNPAAVALGSLGGRATKGKAKNFSADEIARRTEIIRQVNQRRAAAKKGC